MPQQPSSGYLVSFAKMQIFMIQAVNANAIQVQHSRMLDFRKKMMQILQKLVNSPAPRYTLEMNHGRRSKNLLTRSMRKKDENPTHKILKTLRILKIPNTLKTLKRLKRSRSRELAWRKHRNHYEAQRKLERKCVINAIRLCQAKKVRCKWRDPQLEEASSLGRRKLF